MAGSPKKRARKKARELALAQGPGSLPQPETAAPAGTEAPAPCADGANACASPSPGLPALVEDAEFTEIRAAAPAIERPHLENGAAAPLVAELVEPTRTMQRRAMRRKAEAFVDKALEVLAAALDSKDERVRVNAANDILDRAHGKPTPEIDTGDGGLSVVILRFGE